MQPLRTQPSNPTEGRGSATLSCSGDMDAGVPLKAVCATVYARLSSFAMPASAHHSAGGVPVCEGRLRCTLNAAAAAAAPKSEMHASQRPFTSRNSTFGALTSRWTIWSIPRKSHEERVPVQTWSERHVLLQTIKGEAQKKEEKEKNEPGACARHSGRSLRRGACTARRRPAGRGVL